MYISPESYKSPFSSDDSDDVVRLRLGGVIGISSQYWTCFIADGMSGYFTKRLFFLFIPVWL